MDLSGALVFSSGRDGDFDIWKLEFENDEVSQLTTGTDWNDMPRWSPDGRQIAYVSNTTGVPEIWVMNEFGGEKRQITFQNSFNSEPCWSPDGKKIAYCSNKKDADEVEVWIADLESGESEMLFASPGQETGLCWSTDGKSLIFAAPRSGDYDIWSFGLSNQQFKQLTNHKAKDYAPAVSPDGKLIAFVSTRDVHGEKLKEDSDIWLMTSDGMSQPRRLTTSKHADRFVNWSPDGKHLVYCARDSEGADRLHLIDLDEEKISKLTYDRSNLELEIGAEVKSHGLFTAIIPKTLKKKFASSKYFGSERYPDWRP